MRRDLVIELAEFLDCLSPDRFCLDAWVKASGVSHALLHELPPGSRACPLGWLPGIYPEDWCWLSTGPGQAIFPVYKGSTMWGGEVHELCDYQDARWQVGHRAWRQVAEWFELEDVPALEQVLYSRTDATPQEVSRLLYESATQGCFRL